MEYTAFVYKNANDLTSKEEWTAFFDRAREAGIYRGGYALGIHYKIGNFEIDELTDAISGYMHLEADDLEQVMALLRTHPIVAKGGSISLCEIPKKFD